MYIRKHVNNCSSVEKEFDSNSYDNEIAPISVILEKNSSQNVWVLAIKRNGNGEQKQEPIIRAKYDPTPIENLFDLRILLP